MDGQLSRSAAICGRKWDARAIVPRIQECSRTTSGSGVLSGFPTALETTLPRLSLETDASTLPLDREAGQLLVPRDDIPPPPLSSRSEFAASAWPGHMVPLPFVST